MLNDHLGSVSVVTNESGAVVEETTYEPFGAIISGGATSRYDYEGKEFDSVVGDYDFNARRVNPAWGKFTQLDTLLPNVYDPQQLNRYAFERGNPYGYVDPSGNQIVGYGELVAPALSLSALVTASSVILVGAVIVGGVVYTVMNYNEIQADLVYDYEYAYAEAKDLAEALQLINDINKGLKELGELEDIGNLNSGDLKLGDDEENPNYLPQASLGGVLVPTSSTIVKAVNAGLRRTLQSITEATIPQGGNLNPNYILNAYQELGSGATAGDVIKRARESSSGSGSGGSGSSGGSTSTYVPTSSAWSRHYH